MEIKQMLITPNQYSRPQTKMKTIKGVVVHYTGSPNGSGLAIRNYFDNLKNGTRYASAHYVVGLEGEVIQCVPDLEISYHVGNKTYMPGIQAKISNYPNDSLIGIETCYKSADGKFSDTTYNSLIDLCVFLLKKYNLTEKDLYRHYDITGKSCPMYYVNNPAEWTKFVQDVANKMKPEPKHYELIRKASDDPDYWIGIVDEIITEGKKNGTKKQYFGVLLEKISKI